MTAARTPWSHVEFDDVEALPWRSSPTLRWLPLRHALDTLVVGIGGFVAAAAGDDVVEPHRESTDGRGQEEVYLVLRGRARFLLDGEPIEAGAGSFVVVRDPAVHRHAIALEAGTAVIAFGNEPDYEPAASEWIERARAVASRDRSAAVAIVDDLRAQRPGSPAVPLAEAVVAARAGDTAAARQAMATFLQLRPERRDVLAGDADLAPLLT